MSCIMHLILMGYYLHRNFSRQSTTTQIQAYNERHKLTFYVLRCIYQQNVITIFNINVPSFTGKWPFQYYDKPDGYKMRLNIVSKSADMSFGTLYWQQTTLNIPII